MKRFFFKHKGCPVIKRGGWAIEVKDGPMPATRAAIKAGEHNCPGCGAEPTGSYSPDERQAVREGRKYRPVCMGEVSRSRLVSRTTETPCDARCTAAVGPNCDCKCGGENHGTGRLIERIRDLGSAPKQGVLL